MSVGFKEVKERVGGCRFLRPALMARREHASARPPVSRRTIYCATALAWDKRSPLQIGGATIARCELS
jgi:hypothetical protein